MGKTGFKLVSKQTFLPVFLQKIPEGRPLIENCSYFFAVGCTHLDLTPVGRNRQIKKIKPILQDHCEDSMPLLICGDFNDWDGQTTEKMKALHLKTEKIGATFPSFYPVLPLDRIFYRHLNCKKIKVLNDTHWKNLSDHLPMYGEFALLD